MNSTSAFIAGSIVLFGAAAFANIYLPQQAVVHKAAHYVQAAPAPVVPPASPTVKATTPGPFPGDSAPASKSALAPVGTLSAEVPAAVGTVQPQATPVASHKPAKPQPSTDVFSQVHSTKHDKSADSRLRARLAAERRQRALERKRAEAIKRAHAIFKAKRRPAVVYNPKKYELHKTISHLSGKFTLSATLGNRAWIRIGNRKTVTVIAGQAVKGLGTVTAVTPHAVHFSNGNVLRYKQ